MRAVLELLSDDPLAQAVMALAFLGLRPSESRGLKWEDVDFKHAVLRIRRSMWRTHVREGGKGQRSVRDVSFGPVIGGILENYRASLTLPDATTFVLETGTGGTLDVWNFAAKAIRPRLATAGIMWKSFYGGRRGSETELMRYTNGNTQLTAPQYGHSQRVAEGHYVKPLPDETRKAVLALDAALVSNKGQ
jgi:integrase